MSDEKDGVQKKNKAGRPLGATTIKTRSIANKLAAEENTPLEIMIRTMKQLMEEIDGIKPEEIDVSTTEGKKECALLIKERRALRMNLFDLAKDAAPYMHHRLQAITLSGDDDAPPIQVQNVPLSQQELIAEMLARGLPIPTLEK